MRSLNQERVRAIDQFRGFAIICMVLINYGMEIETLPGWLKHSPDIGMTFPDLGTPVFVFAIGLTYRLSFQKRLEKDGLRTTLGHFIRRYLAFLGLGALFSAGQALLGRSPGMADWGVLQAIGAAGLVTLLVIQFPTVIRLLVGLILMFGYQALLDRYWLEIVLNSPPGGLPGALSWSAILILSTVIADFYHNDLRRKYVLPVSILILMAGYITTFFIPLSKNRVSAPYSLITLGFSGVVFAIFFMTDFRLDFFAAWGKNPLLLYFLSLLLTGLFVLPDLPTWHSYAPLWLAGVQAMFLLLILSATALYWDRKEIIISM
jgi:predicted acyltransferase